MAQIKDLPMNWLDKPLYKNNPVVLHGTFKLERERGTHYLILTGENEKQVSFMLGYNDSTAHILKIIYELLEKEYSNGTD